MMASLGQLVKKCLLGLAWDHVGQVSALSLAQIFWRTLNTSSGYPPSSCAMLAAEMSLRATAGGLQMCSMAKPLPASANASEDIKDLLFKPIS